MSNPVCTRNRSAVVLQNCTAPWDACICRTNGTDSWFLTFEAIVLLGVSLHRRPKPLPSPPHKSAPPPAPPFHRRVSPQIKSRLPSSNPSPHVPPPPTAVPPRRNALGLLGCARHGRHVHPRRPHFRCLDPRILLPPFAFNVPHVVVVVCVMPRRCLQGTSTATESAAAGGLRRACASDASCCLHESTNVTCGAAAGGRALRRSTTAGKADAIHMSCSRHQWRRGEQHQS